MFVRGLRVQAQIGVNAEELDRRQPLLADVELEVAVTSRHHLADTVNYETIVTAAQAIVAGGHIALVEDFAQRLAEACLNDPRVLRARVRVEKLEALARHAAAAGVEIVLVRAQA
ncbi:dihydroneopterin aldolase [Caulobacter soli]|uniref:dihydroneopterin aldolase n=1 Tax=Caulobacter soli TaxID=2708539 RepID=UPI0031B57066